MATQLLTADTSVVVPSLLTWHASHRQTAEALKEVHRLPSHVMAEAFSVMTRLPVPHALSPQQARQLLASAFPDEPLGLSPTGYLEIIRKMSEAALGGGRIYDAIVGATAASAGATLLTADRRALPVYALVGANARLVA
ncbi:MAG TPA: PIN domain-containing protein [Candidatus Dormibacteraeota bacterium]|jgi:predicted nucleic acid-binding protein|nr:PIN domain-containing protein [Candidatus Dormibacteraeota bacterium]